MKPNSRHTPEQFIANFFTSFTAATVADDNDPAAIVDRFHTADIVQIADGIRIDRDRLIAHLRPVRKKLTDYRFEVHEALADGDRIAARMTVHATMRKGDTVTTEVFLFGEFDADGRMRHAHQLTRAVPAA